MFHFARPLVVIFLEKKKKKVSRRIHVKFIKIKYHIAVFIYVLSTRTHARTHALVEDQFKYFIYQIVNIIIRIQNIRIDIKF